MNKIIIEELRVRVYTKCKLLVWISSRHSKDHLMMHLLLSFVEILVVHKVAAIKKKFVMKNKILKCIVYPLSLASFDFVPWFLKVLIRFLLVWFSLDFGPFIQKTLVPDR